MKSSILLQFRQFFFYSSGVCGRGAYLTGLGDTKSSPAYLKDWPVSPITLGLAKAFKGTLEVELMKLF